MVYVRHNVNFFVCISFEKVLNIMCRGELIMRKFVILFGIICNMLILLAGCGSREDEISLDTNTVMEQEDEISLDTNMVMEQEDEIPLDTNVVMEQPEYVLNNFDSNNLQVVENHGLILKVPETWEVSVTEEGANKSITTNFEYGFMGIYANYSGEELDLTTFSEDYKNIVRMMQC